MTNPPTANLVSAFNPIQFANASQAAEAATRLDRTRTEVAEADEAASARRLVQRIVAEIAAFEKSVEESADVAMRLVSFGQVSVIRVISVSYAQPNLVIIDGRSESGQPIRLIQHMSQLSFLLTQLPRANPEQPRQPIGFHVG